MGVIHKKSRTTGKRPRRTGEKVAQNTGTDFLALRLGVVLSLPISDAGQNIGSDFVQSGFGVNFLFWSSEV